MSGRTRLPDRVVRFYGNTDFALDAIASRQITFVHVSLLNDPFDPYFYFETDFGADYDQLLAYVRTSHPKHEEWFTRTLSKEGWERSVSNFKSHVEKYKQTTFVFSCSAVTKQQHPRDNLYMWGHYANGHRGVAIEFDATEVTSLLPHHPKHEQRHPVPSDQAWMQTRYEVEIGPFTRKMIFDFLRADGSEGQGKTKLEEYLGEQPRTKSIVWRQENEWRMLWQNDETKMKIHRADVSEKAISAIYVGLAGSARVEDDVKFEAQRKFPAARIFRAFKKQGFSGLGFKQVGGPGASAGKA